MRWEKGAFQETHDKSSWARAWKAQFPHAWGHTEGKGKNAKGSDCPCLAVYLSLQPSSLGDAAQISGISVWF